ncbi:hypothetical protein B0293_30930 [Amycolatopsis azurea DSM 43854]|uniref:Uncharacterized protein n=1 Tax=Amycolatopsis azurea DSM 43854 TaxID=1238180 RepID=A0ABX3J4L2_9PSEU|nr:hypothetical protein B0293_30930 [Amycolatopsis azurea DSM 43854]
MPSNLAGGTGSRTFRGPPPPSALHDFALARLPLPGGFGGCESHFRNVEGCESGFRNAGRRRKAHDTRPASPLCVKALGVG